MRLKKLMSIGVIMLMVSHLTIGCGKSTEGEVEEGSSTETVEGTTEQQEQSQVDSPTTAEVEGLIEEDNERVVPKDAEVHFIQTGLAESTLIRDHNKYMLIDGGSKKSQGKVVSYLQNKGVKELEYLILTQWDNDSLGDILNVVTTFNIKYIIAPELKETSIEEAKVIKQKLDEKKLFITVPKVNGVEYTLGEGKFSLLNRVANYDNENDNALAVSLDLQGTKILISSDSSKIESDLKGVGEVDIFVATNHGKDSEGYNSVELLKTLKPKYSVIPTDGSTSFIDYREVEKRLKVVGSKVYKTDNSSVVFKITDDGITLK